MDQIDEFVDDRKKGWCVHCGGSIAGLDANRDHVPSICLLRKPHPANLPVIVCKKCNEGFSPDEEYVAAFLGCVVVDSTDPDCQNNPRIAAILRRSPSLKARIGSGRIESPTLFGEARAVWIPERDRINRVIVKNARGHAFFEYGELMLQEPERVWAAPLESLSPDEREGFEHVLAEGLSQWPEVGSRMLTRVVTGRDLVDGWVIVQEEMYRYAVAEEDRILVRSVLYEYLATEVRWSD